jgi:hypothetical protein
MTDPFAKAMKDLFNTSVGADALYTPVTGAAIPCRVILERNVEIQPSSSITAPVLERGTTIETLLADVVTEPGQGSTFIVNPETADEETFTVQSITENDGLSVKMIVT